MELHRQALGSFYPKLDPEDNSDPTLRVNVLKGFDGDGSASDLWRFKLRLREVTVTNSRPSGLGKFGFRDIQIGQRRFPWPVKAGGKESKPPDIKPTQCCPLRILRPKIYRRRQAAVQNPSIA